MDRDRLRKAILWLDPTWKYYWVPSGPDKGKPKLQQVRNCYNGEANDGYRVTRQDIDAAMPGYNREAAYETALRGGVVPPEGFTAPPRTEKEQEIIDSVLKILAGIDACWVAIGKHAGKPRCAEVAAGFCCNATRKEIDAAMPGYTRKQAWGMAAAGGRSTN